MLLLRLQSALDDPFHRHRLRSGGDDQALNVVYGGPRLGAERPVLVVPVHGAALLGGAAGPHLPG